MRCYVSLFVLFCISLIHPDMSAQAQSLLWRIDLPAAEAPSWVFGTMHARCAQDIQLSDELRSAISQAEQLALELDLDDPALALRVAKYAFMPKDSTLQRLLSPGAYDTLSAFLRDSVSMSISNVESMRPLFLIGLLVGNVLGCTPVSYEDRLMDIARSNTKEIIGIETVEEQFAAFASIPLREQARMVLETIRNLDSTRVEFRRLDAAYANADLDALLVLVQQSDVEFGRYQDSFLSDRNHRWISRMLTIAKSRSTVFAVGAAHLPGKDGVLSLLRSQGCTVTPIIAVSGSGK